jgi:hypothetical protein
VMYRSSGIRYTSAHKCRAEELRHAGWAVPGIVKTLEREMGVAPTETTVRCWVDPAYRRKAETRNARNKRAKAIRTKGIKGRPVSRELADERMAEMRRRGVSIADIGIVAGIWFLEPLTQQQVRRRLLESNGLEEA